MESSANLTSNNPNCPDSVLACFHSTHRLLMTNDASMHHWRLHLSNLKIARVVLTHLIVEIDKLIAETEERITVHERLDRNIAEFERIVNGRNGR